MKKKIFTALLSFIALCAGISAQEAAKNHGHLALGVEASSTGFGLELAAPLNSNFALRGGVSLFPSYNYNYAFNVNLTESIKNNINNEINSEPDILNQLNQNGLPTRAEDIDTNFKTTAALNFLNGKILIDFYPSAKYAFHITGGVYIGKSDIVKIKGKMDQAVEVLKVLQPYHDYFNETVIADGNYQLTGNDLRDMQGVLRVNSVKPYFGIGFGRAAPKSRVGVNFEIGAFYQGAPKLAGNNNNVQKLIDSESSRVTDVLNQLPVYPVISLKLNFRLF